VVDGYGTFFDVMAARKPHGYLPFNMSNDELGC
jgi:hypothetical protein